MSEIKIADKTIGEYSKSFIIAEAGVNHNGSIEMAKKLVNAAKEAGADAVKFQTFKTKNLVTKNAKKAEYQIKNSGEESQYEMIKKLELSDSEFHEIAKYAESKGIIFLSSPFDIESVDLLDEMNIPAFKIASGEITNFPLLKHIAKKHRPVILSTGMSTIGEVEEALNLIEKYNDDIILMHCLTNYPAKKEDANLNVIKTLEYTFKRPVGFSDHTSGIEMSVAAVALGSCVIEKHFTLDKNLPGPDHKASLEPQELYEMVKAVRNVETGLGNGIKKPTNDEIKIKKLVRKSIVAKEDILKGSILTEEMLNIKRPGTGIEPKYLDELVGRELIDDVKKDDLLKWNQLK
ncbi:N-acetylneuraminate synthase [Methanobacterium sp. MBAC-LM]|uniref:N-acetylneuraminate synthase n=1 Tax=Methanobacterium sp. MBAC-LM TaxID=3412034 RepID=UPI003C74672D